MAQKTVCDLCDKDITTRDKMPFELTGGKTIRLGAQQANADGSHFVPMDLCLTCMFAVIKHVQLEQSSG